MKADDRTVGTTDLAVAQSTRRRATSEQAVPVIPAPPAGAGRDTLARRFVSLEVVASELQVTWRTAYAWVRQGQLPAIMIGDSEWRIERSVLEQFAHALSDSAAARPARRRPSRAAHAV